MKETLLDHISLETIPYSMVQNILILHIPAKEGDMHILLHSMLPESLGHKTIHLHGKTHSVNSDASNNATISKLEEKVGCPLHLVLGMDVLQHTAIEIDQVKKEVRFVKGGTIPASLQTLKVVCSWDSPFTTLHVGERLAIALVSTAFTRSFTQEDHVSGLQPIETSQLATPADSWSNPPQYTQTFATHTTQGQHTWITPPSVDGGVFENAPYSVIIGMDWLMN